MRYRIQEAVVHYNYHNNASMTMAELSRLVITDRTKRNGEPISDQRKMQFFSDWNKGRGMYSAPTEKELKAIMDITGYKELT